jgi:tRNA 2-thiouridine synthesizing protein B
MLFLVNKAPLSNNSLESALRIAPPGAPILLYEDGVYAALAGARSETMVARALCSHAVYALGADLEARGLRQTIPGVQIIGYDGFVELVEQQDVAPWL